MRGDSLVYENGDMDKDNGVRYEEVTIYDNRLCAAGAGPRSPSLVAWLHDVHHIQMHVCVLIDKEYRTVLLRNGSMKLLSPFGAGKLTLRRRAIT